MREWSDVSREARQSGGKKKAQVGRVFGICVGKGSELPKGAKGRAYKGRLVFGGDFVRDEYAQEGIFKGLSEL